MPTVPLDADQQAAVAHRDGACLVLAGPGSGKTRVIVERFLALCADGVGPDRQLVLTYTIRAAGEMRRRAEEVSGPSLGEVALLNFHSFARRVLREWGWLIGIPPTFHIADHAEQWLHLDAVLQEMRPRTLWNPLRPHDLVDGLLSLIGTAKQELITPEHYASWAAARLEQPVDDAERLLLLRHQESAEVYARLDERHRSRAALDHDDCILYAERLLRENPAVRTALCDRIRQVMVDEYQDTNYAQAKMVEALVAGHGNLLVVADDDQSIYKFRGASRANLERFQRLYPGHATVVLHTNYRSTAKIVATCRALIATADPLTRVAKDVQASRGGGTAVEVWTATDERSEALAIAAQCRQLVESGTSPDQIAWLFRQHADMRAGMNALQELGVPYRIHGGHGYWQQPEIKALMALLNAVDDPTDSQAMLRCLHLPSWAVSNRGRLALARACDRVEIPLCELVNDAAISNLDDVDGVAAQRCASALVELSASSLHADVRDLFFDALEASGFMGILDLTRDIERVQAGTNLNRFGELLESFAEWSEDLRLRAALRYLTVMRDSGKTDDIPEIETVDEGVTLLTAHGSKGLEWPVVIVGHCSDDRWPGRGGFGARLQIPDELVPEQAPPGDSHVDEERRLLYVACTRARDRLILSHAQHYPQSFREERQSRFLTAIAAHPAAPVPVAVPFVAPAPRRRLPRGDGRQAPPTEVSVSELRDFRDCPRRYEYGHRYRLPVRTSVQQWYGTLVHRTLERAARLRLAGEDVDSDRMSELWAQAWDGDAGPKGLHATLRDYGEDSLRRYAESDAWTSARIASVEERFAVSVDAAALSGRFDRIDKGSGTPVVIDYKTGPPRTEEAASRDLQVRAYAVALAQRERADSCAVELHHLQTAEVTRVEFDKSTLHRAFGHVSATAGDLIRAWEDRHFPPNPAPWRCRRCDYRTICDERAE
ncbi:MAG TPA: ATP-dependent DNA helicase [Candidatus Dormibacteraeota bacterium]|nr:ATP-dependent DNA helicase [Candidatus Dormibacteraeota bacterium]